MRKLVFPIFLILVFLGLVILASAGVVEGQKKFDDSYYYVKHQLLFGVLLGAVIFLICSKIPYKKWKSYSLPILLIILGLLVLVFVPSFGVDIKGAQRWIDLGIATIQPSEFLKLALVLYLSAWFARRRSDGLLPFFIVLAFTGLLLALQPDFGTLGIVLIIGVALYFFSGVKLKNFIVILLIIAVLGGSLAVAAPYRFDRVKAFLNPARDKQGTAYHINQALISIGSGGIWGLGYGQSKQKFNFLPEPVGDSIFAIFVEEMGFAGAVILLSLFIGLILGLASIAKNTTDDFAKLFALGIAVWIGSQTFTNIAAISGIIPLTGVPLPLISYGSSSLISLMAGMGIIKNITSS